MKRTWIAFLICCAAMAQVAEQANQAYKTQQGRDAIAHSLAAPGRDATERPREIVEAMGLRPGMRVADVGTGVGYMLPYLSHAVGPKGEVVAEDIAPDFLERAKLRARSIGLTNITFVLGTERDSKLPGGVLDAVLILDAYHHFDYPEAMLHTIRDSLVSDGKMFIVEFYKRENAMGPGTGDRALTHIRLDQADLIKEVEDNGFHLLWKRDHIPNSQYIAAFDKQK